MIRKLSMKRLADASRLSLVVQAADMREDGLDVRHDAVVRVFPESERELQGFSENFVEFLWRHVHRFRNRWRQLRGIVGVWAVSCNIELMANDCKRLEDEHASGLITCS